MSITNWVLAVLAGLVLLLLIWLSLLSLAFRRQTRAKQKAVAALTGDRGLLTVVSQLLDSVDTLSAEQTGMLAEINKHDLILGKVIKHVGIIRYDAFTEVGGQLSFSAALLDAGGDGIVITSINGRSESRVYAKSISQGKSAHNLSVEEEEAITQAYKEVKV